MKPRFDSDFSFTVESQLNVDGSQSWCFPCQYLKLSVKRVFNLHVLVKGHIDGLPLSWELSYEACSTRCFSDFSSLTGTLKTDKKRVPFVHSLWEFSRGGHARYSWGSHWNTTPASATHSHASTTWEWKEKVYGTCYYSWNCDLTWS